MKKKSLELTFSTIAIVILVLLVIVVSVIIFVPLFHKEAKKIEKSSPDTNLKNLSEDIIEQFD